MITKADEHLLKIAHKGTQTLLGGPVQQRTLGKTSDYLAPLTIIVEEEVSCFSRHYHGLEDMAHQRRLINVTTLVFTTQSRATQTRVRVKVVSHSSPAC